ncbi:MAG TPA: hypothetical protein P5305_21735 [Rubrivivax sp.]|nr:hypothetical protein [Rubrivivax sp.]
MSDFEVMQRPIDSVLYCPKCGWQHIDAPDTNYDPQAGTAQKLILDLRTALAAHAEKHAAELAKAKAMPMKYRRMEFNAQLQTENDALRAQVDARTALLREFVELLEPIRLGRPSDDARLGGLMQRAEALTGATP